MAFSLRRATGLVLLLAGVLLFIQLLQMFFGAQAFFGLGVLSLLFRGGLGALVETFVLSLVCLGVGWWLVRGEL